MKVKLISVTPDAEKTISFCARVSNPKNQENYTTAPKLIGYCIKNGHHSIMEMANMCVEITTGRDIAAQILRHKSFSFQEYSQRYATSTDFERRNPRRQDTKNRQNSLDDFTQAEKDWFTVAQDKVWQTGFGLYEEALSRGIAKESARALLPLATRTTLYMNGSIRSWVHYCLVRCEKATQLEHREIANQCYKILREHVPSVTQALEETHPWLKEIV
jgi:thymidylate synthase (FAD)